MVAMIFLFILVLGLEISFMVGERDGAKHKVLYWVGWISAIVAPFGIVPLVSYLWQFVDKRVAGIVGACFVLLFFAVFIIGHISGIFANTKLGKRYIFKHGERVTEIMVSIFMTILYVAGISLVIFTPAICFYYIIGFFK